MGCGASSTTETNPFTVDQHNNHGSHHQHISPSNGRLPSRFRSLVKPPPYKHGRAITKVSRLKLNIHLIQIMSNKILSFNFLFLIFVWFL